MTELSEPNGQDPGEARRFLTELGSAWSAFHGIETTAPLAELRFDDGRMGYVGDLPETNEDLFACLSALVEIPHTGTVHAEATVWHQEGPPFDLQLAYEGVDGPLVIRFIDGTLLAGVVETSRRVQCRWDTAVSTGLLQQQLEAITSLANLAAVTNAFAAVDQPVADALLELLGRFSTTKHPPRAVVREALRWLGHKVDVFVEEAAKTGGKAAGTFVAGVAGYVVMKHMPQLRHVIQDALEATG